MYRLEMQRFAMEFRRLPIALKFPRKHSGMVFVVAECLAIGGLMFLAEMPASRFVALERVRTHQLSKFEKIGDAPGAFKGLVKIFVAAQDAHLAPELFSQFGNFFERFAQSFFVARHSAFVPEKQTELSVERIERTRSIDFQEFLDPGANIFFCFLKLRRIRRRPFSHLSGEIIWERVRQNEVTVSQTLHQRA